MFLVQILVDRLGKFPKAGHTISLSQWRCQCLQAGAPRCVVRSGLVTLILLETVLPVLLIHLYRPSLPFRFIVKGRFLITIG